MESETDMTQIRTPRYELFSKRIHREEKERKKTKYSKKSKSPENKNLSAFHGKDGKCPKNKLKITEKWFEERLSTRQSPPPIQSSLESSPVLRPISSPITIPQDNLSLEELETQLLKRKHIHCSICNNSENTMESSNYLIDEMKSLYNRCPNCNKVIHEHLLNEYEGCDELKGIDYNNFRYDKKVEQRNDKCVMEGLCMIPEDSFDYSNITECLRLIEEQKRKLDDFCSFMKQQSQYSTPEIKEGNLEDIYSPNYDLVKDDYMLYKEWESYNNSVYNYYLSQGEQLVSALGLNIY